MICITLVYFLVFCARVEYAQCVKCTLHEVLEMNVCFGVERWFIIRAYKLLLGLYFYSEGEQEAVCLDEPRTPSHVWKILGKAGGKNNYKSRCQQIFCREM